MSHPQSTDVVSATRIVLPGLVAPSGLEVHEELVGPPAEGQALLRMDATGVSFAEFGMRRGLYPGQPAFPFVLGYDVVGTVTAVGPGVETSLVGRRVAAVTKTGAWSTYVVAPADDLVEVPEGLDPAEVETVVVNGITAWQMLHRSARVRPGQTVLVHGANGGVGSTLVQLARHAGLRVIGTAHPRHHDALRALGAEPVDYAAEGLSERVRALAPDGVDAVFDHLGGASVGESYRLLAPGGALVAYGMATLTEDQGSPLLQFVPLLARLALWNVLPNGHRASFYNFWAGSRLARAGFRARLRTDLGEVLRLLGDGALTAHVAARVPLREAARAMELAESRTVLGKVVLVP